MAKVTTARQLIGNINFELLKAQKLVLLELQGKPYIEPNGPEWLAIEGMLALVDAVQDCAVDSIGFARNHVFNLSDEVGHMNLQDAENVLLENSIKDAN